MSPVQRALSLFDIVALGVSHRYLRLGMLSELYHGTACHQLNNPFMSSTFSAKL